MTDRTPDRAAKLVEVAERLAAEGLATRDEALVSILRAAELIDDQARLKAVRLQAIRWLNNPLRRRVARTIIDLCDGVEP